ncbi:MAG: PAS domain S-box protein [Dehalococcoidales bacterium]|nr:PAS domain S-box protein [Dehalococcoidales bacterium]
MGTITKSRDQLIQELQTLRWRVAELETSEARRKQTEVELMESEQRFRAVFNNAADGIIIADTETAKFYAANETISRMLGYSSEELENLWVMDIHPETDLPYVTALFQKPAKKGSTMAHDIPVKRKDGSVFFADVNSFPIILSGKEYLVGIFHDITERKQAEEQLRQSEEKFAKAFHSSPDAMSITTIPEGRYLDINRGFTRITGHHRAKVIGRTSLELGVWTDSADRTRIQNMVLEQGRVKNQEVRYRKKSGEVFLGLLSAERIEINGQPCLLSVVTDITKRWQTIEALRQSEEKYRSLVEDAHAGVATIDRKGKITFVNKAMAQITGYTGREIRGKQFTSFLYPKDKERIKPLLQEALYGSGNKHHLELRAVHKKGQIIYLYASLTPIKEEGETIGFNAAVTDITERKQAEEALRQSERHYRLLAENTKDVIWTVDLDMHLTFITPSVTSLLGYTVEEALAKKMVEVFTPASFDRAMEAFYEEMSAETRSSENPSRSRAMEIELVRKDGSTVPVEIKCGFLRSPDGKPAEILVTARDITGHRQIEKQLRQSETKYVTLVEQGNDGIIILQDGVVKFANSQIMETTGFTAQSTIGRAFIDFVAPKYKQLVIDRYRQRLAGHETPNRYEIEILTLKGASIPVEINASVIEYEGKPADMAIIRDITDRKRTEEALRQTIETMRLMFDSVTDGILVTDLNGKITGVNESLVHLHGYTREEMIGLNITDLVAPNDRTKVMENTKNTLENGKTTASEYTLLTGKSGEFTADLSTAVFKDSYGNATGLVAVIRDITERKRMQEQLIVTDRLASIGELAAGIAHEINNPLTSVIGFSQLLLNRDLGSDVRKDLEIVSSEAQRAVRVVKNLLTFARKHPTTKQMVDLNSVINKVLELRSYEQKVNNIQVIKDLAPDLPEITIDYFQMQQVFLNIIINAEYFMNEAHHGGTMVITTIRSGDNIKIAFKDDGPGIPREILGHLFDPFFTTKEVGKGTGLGLSICHGIITEHNGRIYAESEPGKGATFTVELPII